MPRKELPVRNYGILTKYAGTTSEMALFSWHFPSHMEVAVRMSCLLELACTNAPCVCVCVCVCLCMQHSKWSS